MYRKPVSFYAQNAWGFAPETLLMNTAQLSRIGGCAVLGLVAGRTKNYESERIAFTATRELHDRFRAQHKALCCRALTRNVKWNSAEHKIQCEKYVLEATKITSELLHTRLAEYLPGETQKAPKMKKNPLALFRRLTDRSDKP